MNNQQILSVYNYHKLKERADISKPFEQTCEIDFEIQFNFISIEISQKSVILGQLLGSAELSTALLLHMPISGATLSLLFPQNTRSSPWGISCQ